MRFWPGARGWQRRNRLWPGDIPSGTISGSGSGPYTYNLSFSDDSSATSPIGSVWYAWVPFQFFLPGTPTSATAPAGWSASIVGNSIEFTANSTANVIPAGGTLSGFSYQAAYSPATLAATANSGESDAYAGIAIESDAGKIFTVAVQPAPEPSVLALLASGGAGLVLVRPPQDQRSLISFGPIVALVSERRSLNRRRPLRAAPSQSSALRFFGLIRQSGF